MGTSVQTAVDRHTETLPRALSDQIKREGTRCAVEAVTGPEVREGGSEMWELEGAGNWEGKGQAGHVGSDRQKV